jgi:hypothetical protein
MLQIMIAVIGIGLIFALGRVTAGHDRGYSTGLREGKAQGIQEGRAYQVTQPLPRDVQGSVKTAFNEGYAAGENDAFGGYDGGWGLSEPYVISLVRGEGPVTYRISSRTLLQEGTAYYLCPHSHALCTEPHRGG